MKWYFLIHKGLSALPTSGTYDDGSHTVWKNIRCHCGVGGEDDDGVNLWDADCARHTVASSIHRLQMDERAYWTDMFGHSAEMLQRAYKNPSVDKAQANEYMSEIQPPNVIREREAAKSYSADLAKAKAEACEKNSEFKNLEEYTVTENILHQGKEIESQVTHHITEEFPAWFKEKWPDKFKELEPYWD